MLFGLDGVEIGLIIVFLTLFAGILSGFPVAFAISGSAVISFGIIAALDSSGLLTHMAVDQGSDAFRALVDGGVRPDSISHFRYPELPRVAEHLFPAGWEQALDRNVGFLVNRMNERVLAGQSIETLLAVLMFVMMGIVLERSKIADELLTTMAKVFGPLPGGLAVSIVIVGAFLAASTGIVGATVVTMGLLALPTMLKNGYSPELSTGVIAASGTLGQIIPPSIVIVLLGTLAGDLYSAAQEERANLVGCSDALTYLGEPAVVSVGTLFQAALLPGILLAFLYAAYAFGFAMFNPSKAPAVQMGHNPNGEVITRTDGLMWFLAIPVGLIGLLIVLGQVGVVGSQSVIVDSYTDAGQTASLRTRVSDECAVAMKELHGEEKWATALAEQEAINEAGGVTEARQLGEEERAALVQEKIENAPVLGKGLSVLALLMGLMLVLARGVAPSADHRPLMIGGLGVLLMVAVDAFLISPVATAGTTTVLIAIPLLIAFTGLRAATKMLGKNEILRVVFPPLVLIIAVLGSIMGGITNPTPAAALGAGGAILLAAYRKLQEERRSGKMVLWTAASIAIMLLYSWMIHRWLLRSEQNNVYLLLLVGLVLTLLINTLTQLIQFTISPGEFSLLLGYSQASFNRAQPLQLLITATMVCGVCGVIWKALPTFDVLSLGRHQAMSLGVDYAAFIKRHFALIALLVAISTSLLGPTAFMGIFVANTAYALARVPKHRLTLSTGCAIAIAAFLFAQILVEHVFNYKTTVGILVNLMCGVYFLVLVVRPRRAS